MEEKTVQGAQDMQTLEGYFIEQRKYQKRQGFLTLIRTAAVVGMFAVLLIAALMVLPRLNSALDSLEGTAEVITALELEPMVESVTELATAGTEGITDALDDVTRALAKIEQLDIDGLNQSIEDLGTVVGPLAKLFGK